MMTVVTRLGIIACRYLATRYYDSRYISAPEIAESHRMNVRALMPALRQLTRAGILHSRVGGNMPGFKFSESPKKITLLQILTVLEGHTRFPCCKELIPDLDCGRCSKEVCETFLLVNEIIKDTTMKLNSITIADFAKICSNQ